MVMRYKDYGVIKRSFLRGFNIIVTEANLINKRSFLFRHILKYAISSTYDDNKVHTVIRI